MTQPARAGIHRRSGHSGAVFDVAFSPDGSTLPTTSWDVSRPFHDAVHEPG